MGAILYRHCLPPLMDRYDVRVVQESGFVAGIKEMALAGMGMAWLPERLIIRELKTGTLVRVGRELPEVEVPVSLYRMAPRGAASASATDQIWNLFEERAQQAAPPV
jgi:LysR family transcriptional regulator, hypochlorite-specific transcription factor HypT